MQELKCMFKIIYDFISASPPKKNLHFEVTWFIIHKCNMYFNCMNVSIQAQFTELDNSSWTAEMLSILCIVS